MTLDLMIDIHTFNNLETKRVPIIFIAAMAFLNYLI